MHAAQALSLYPKKIKSTAAGFFFVKRETIFTALITLPLYLIFLNRATKLCFYKSNACSSALIVKDVRSKCCLNTTRDPSSRLSNCRLAEVAANGRGGPMKSFHYDQTLSSSRSSSVQLWTLQLQRDRMRLNAHSICHEKKRHQREPEDWPSASAASPALKAASVWMTREPLKIGPPPSDPPLRRQSKRRPFTPWPARRVTCRLCRDATFPCSSPSRSLSFIGLFTLTGGISAALHLGNSRLHGALALLSVTRVNISL